MTKVKRKTEVHTTEIIDKHMDALLRDLHAHGVYAIGVAGGIIINGSTPLGGSPCHVFCAAMPGLTSEDGNQSSVEAFVEDVAKTMLAPERRL